MIDQADQQTLAIPLDEQPAKRKRGRPATGTAMTPAEKQRAYRERQKAKARKSLMSRLLQVRLSGPGSEPEYIRSARFGAVQGYLGALEDLGVITWDESCRLTDLLLNASKHAGEPFPCELNAGPVMPSIVAYNRRCAPHDGQVKPSA